MFSRAPGEVRRCQCEIHEQLSLLSCSQEERRRILSPHAGCAGETESTIECTHWFLKGTPSEASLIGIRREQEVQTDKVRFPNVAKYSLGLLKTQIPWTLPSEILSSWAPGWVWKSGFIRSLPSGFDDQPSLGMVGLIFIVSSCLWPEVAYVQK